MNFPITTIKSSSKHYPKLLSHIKPAPKQLYCRGDISLLEERCFAVVGTRRTTPYGKEVVKKIIPDLARHFVIVSGLALGIDGLAHEATLEAKGKTIAVLGCGVDDTSIYPANHARLAQRILKEGGLILSEYPPGTRARDYMFPERNRIVSGLSKGVLIIEADEKSGSLITASWAADQSRDVFAVPGSIFSARTAGPHALIKKGAKLVSSSEDIFEEYDMLGLDKNRRMSTAEPAEQKILAILEASGPSHPDTIINQSGLDASDIMATLSIMEIKGMVCQMDNGTFRKTE